MVVIVVLGILSGIAVPKVLGHIEKTKEKADLMKLYCLREALNRALLENSEALYKSSFVSSGDKAADNLSKLKKKLASETGVDLFVIEMRPDLHTNIQNNHASINKDSEMSKLIGESGTWYDALKDSGFPAYQSALSFLSLAFVARFSLIVGAAMANATMTAVISLRHSIGRIRVCRINA